MGTRNHKQIIIKSLRFNINEEKFNRWFGAKLTYTTGSEVRAYMALKAYKGFLLSWYKHRAMQVNENLEKYRTTGPSKIIQMPYGYRSMQLNEVLEKYKTIQ